MIFNQRLRQLREQAGQTQEQVAKRIGFQGRSYQRLEADNSVPSYKALERLADYFNVSVDYLMGRTERREVNR